jgi:ATP dependent DNA ligase domain
MKSPKRGVRPSPMLLRGADTPVIRMLNTNYLPCIPTRGTKVPSHHEIKQDGFRLIVYRDGDRVRLFTRNGYDWTIRYPLIVETPAEYSAGLNLCLNRGWLEIHESGTYVKFTAKEAELLRETVLPALRRRKLGLRDPSRPAFCRSARLPLRRRRRHALPEMQYLVGTR